MAWLPQLIGFLATRGQRQQEFQARQQKMDYMKSQKQLMDMGIKKNEQILETIKSLPEELQPLMLMNPEIGSLLVANAKIGMPGQEQPTGQAPFAQPTAEVGPPVGDVARGPGLAGEIAGMQLGPIQNIIPDLLRHKYGVGRSAEVLPPVQMSHPETGEPIMVPRSHTGFRFDLAYPAPPEYATQTIKEPSGAERVIQYDKLRGFRPGGIQAIPTAPGTMEMPIKTTELPLWVHPQSLESPPPGMSPAAAEKAGFRKVSTEAKNRIDAAKGMMEVVAKLGELMKQVFPPSGGLRERMTGAPSRLFGAQTQYDPIAAQLQSFINGTVAPLIRSFGEKGNLSETDVKRAINLMPKITDSADVAWGKFNNIVELMNNIQKSAVAGKPGLSLKPQPKKKRFELVK